LALQSLLIQPIQRIPRYSLLVQDLLKHTESSHSDYSNISYTHKKLLDIANFINGQKQTYDRIDKIVNTRKSVKLSPRIYLSKTESGRIKVFRKTYSESQRKSSRIEISPDIPEVLQVIEDQIRPEESNQGEEGSRNPSDWMVIGCCGLFVVFIGSVLFYQCKVKLYHQNSTQSYVQSQNFFSLF